MADEYLVKSLKRLHDECERSIADDNFKFCQSLAERFNDVLENFQEEYPDKERIESIEEAKPISTDGTRGAIQNGSKALNEIQNIKLRTLQIADLLDINTSDFERMVDSGEMTVINLEQNQSVSQSITVNNLMKQVDNMMMPDPQKDELKEVIQSFEAELEDDPDTSTLRELIDKARDFSAQVAMKMAMIALERGIDVLADV